MLHRIPLLLELLSRDLLLLIFLVHFTAIQSQNTRYLVNITLRICSRVSGSPWSAYHIYQAIKFMEKSGLACLCCLYVHLDDVYINRANILCFHHPPRINDHHVYLLPEPLNL